MQLNHLIVRLSEDWGIEIQKGTVLHYEKAGVFQPDEWKNGARQYTEKEYVELMKIVILSKLFNIPLDLIGLILSGNKEAARAVKEGLSSRKKTIAYLLEVL